MGAFSGNPVASSSEEVLDESAFSGQRNTPNVEILPMFAYYFFSCNLHIVINMFNFAHSTWIAHLSGALAPLLLSITHNINVFDILILLSIEFVCDKMN